MTMDTSSSINVKPLTDVLLMRDSSGYLLVKLRIVEKTVFYQALQNETLCYYDENILGVIARRMMLLTCRRLKREICTNDIDNKSSKQGIQIQSCSKKSC